MEVIIAVLGGFSFAAIVYIGVYFRIITKNKTEFLDWFLLAMATFNGLGFGFVIWATYEGRNPILNFTNSIMSYDTDLIFVYILLNVVLLLSVFFGWHLTIILKNSLNCRGKELKSYKEDYFIKKIVIVSWLLLFIAVITYWLYTRAFGGFIQYLDYGLALRSGITTINNPFSFLHRFGGLAFFSSFVFFALLIDKKNKDMIKKKLIFFGFIFSFCFSLYVLISWVGRVSLVVFISTFILGYILYSYKSIFSLVRKIISFSIVMLMLLIFADIILGRSGGTLGFIEFFTKELSFPFVNFYTVSGLTEYRFFIDIIVAPLYLLPMRVWSGLFNIETASSFNTYLITGARKGEAGIYGEAPVDLLSFGFMQANVLGVVIVGLIIGLILYILQSITNKIPTQSIRSIISANLIFSVGLLTILYGDTQHMIVRNFDMIVGFIVLWLFLKFNFQK